MSAPRVTGRGGAAVPEVQRDQGDRDDQEHAKYQACTPAVVHCDSSSVPLRPMRPVWYAASAVSVWSRAPAPDARCRSPRHTCPCRAPPSPAGCPRPARASRSPRGSADSSPRSRAPPPVSAMPRSMTSPASSGGHLSSVFLTASMIRLTGSSIARRTSAAEITMVLGRPLTRSRPRISACGSSVGGEGRADRHLDLLGGPLAEHQRVLLLAEGDDRLVELVAADPDGLGGDDAAERDHRDLGGAAADVDHHVAGRLVDRQAGADRRGHRLLDDVHLAGAGLVAGFLDRALLDPGDAARHARRRSAAWPAGGAGAPSG